MHAFPPSRTPTTDSVPSSRTTVTQKCFKQITLMQSFTRYTSLPSHTHTPSHSGHNIITQPVSAARISHKSTLTYITQYFVQPLKQQLHVFNEFLWLRLYRRHTWIWTVFVINNVGDSCHKMKKAVGSWTCLTFLKMFHPLLCGWSAGFSKR